MKKKSPDLQWVARQIVFADLLEELHRHFAAAGVRYMPVKGAWLIATGLAARIETRAMQDLDIMVLPQDFDRALSYFAACTQVRIEDDPWYFEKTLWIDHRGQRLQCELHWLLNRPERFLLPTEELFSRAAVVDTWRMVATPADALAIAVCHGLVHIGWGGWRDDLLSDCRVIMAHQDFSHSQFMACMQRSGIKPFLGFLQAVSMHRSGSALFLQITPTLRDRLLAALFRHCYGRIPVPIQRLLFELPYVRQPLRLMRGGR